MFIIIIIIIIIIIDIRIQFLNNSGNLIRIRCPGEGE